MATEVFAQVATIARITDVLGDDGSSAFGDEEAIARSFCGRAAARADRSLAQLADNDDNETALVADQLIERGRYVHSI